MHELREETVRVGEVELSLLRPASPEALLDEEAFAHDEFLPYWAELWPAASALAAALPAELRGLRIVELGCGLGVPSLVAARRGADVVATDWAADAIDLLRAKRRAERRSRCDARGLGLARAVGRAVRPRARRRRPLRAAQRRAGRSRALRRLAPEALVGLAGRPYEAEFLRAAGAWIEVAPRVVRVSPDQPLGLEIGSQPQVFGSETQAVRRARRAG